MLRLFFAVFCVAMAMGMSPARADTIEDIIGRMKPSGQQEFYTLAQKLKDAGHQTFYKIDGYQARILRSFCSEFYGPRFTGEVPPLLVAGYSGVKRGKADRPSPQKKVSLWDTLNEVSKRCERSGLVSSLLKEYWGATSNQVESYLTRLAKLINTQNGQMEYLIFGNRETARGEAAIANHSSAREFFKAASLDTEAMEQQIFGDLNLIYTRVKMRLSIADKFHERFPTEQSLVDAQARFAEDIAEAERLVDAGRR